MPTKMGTIALMKGIFRSPYYIIFTIAAAVAYYYLITYLIQADNNDAFLITVPSYLVYLLVLVSSVLLTVSVYSIQKAFKATKSGVGGSVLSVISTIFSGLIFSCGCTAPLLNIILGVFVLNLGEIVSLRDFLSSYQVPIISAIILLDIAFISYQLTKLKKTCTIDKGKVIGIKVKLK